VAEALSAAVVGVSRRPVCGVRDHARLLSDALGESDVACTLHWLAGAASPLRAARSETRAWARDLGAELSASRPDAILLHYSVFAYSYRGLPVFVRPTVAALREVRAPVLAVLHELAYPWTRGGWRGNMWALTHRAVLIEVIRACSAAIVTADFRAEWLASRPWLPRRPVAVAPVFSNLPTPVSRPQRQRSPAVIGLFGYSEPATAALVVEALALVQRRGRPVSLTLLGAPGPVSPVGQAWSEAARGRGLACAPSFSGTLAPQELSNALAACDVLLYVDTAGPVSRKGTLAASLASGRPVIALEGGRRWLELDEAGAVRVAPRTSHALAEAICDLLADEAAREALGVSGREFAKRRMSVEGTAQTVAELLRQVVSGPS
jgi:glycosyltransferase involved in cell wall biosynthesis